MEGTVAQNLTEQQWIKSGRDEIGSSCDGIATLGLFSRWCYAATVIILSTNENCVISITYSCLQLSKNSKPDELRMAICVRQETLRDGNVSVFARDPDCNAIETRGREEDLLALGRVRINHNEN